MLYELSLVTKADLGEQGADTAKKIVHDVLKSFGGEVLIEDDWGKLSLAQATSNGEESGVFTYFLYKTDDNTTNVELARRFKITEDVLRSMVVKASDDNAEAAEIVKNFKCPYSKKYAGSVTDSDDKDGSMEKDRRRFAKRKACWFTANKIQADWKDPKTFSWLVNEFGKISPARISGISRKHQRFATTAIKRARQIGIASYVSSRMAE